MSETKWRIEEENLLGEALSASFDHHEIPRLYSCDWEGEEEEERGSFFKPAL